MNAAGQPEEYDLVILGSGTGAKLRARSLMETRRVPYFSPHVWHSASATRDRYQDGAGTAASRQSQDHDGYLPAGS